MAGITLSMSTFFPVHAAAPQVLVDETMYVNLDYYGKETQVNVVKGCSTNGVVSYTDYGVYEKVVNMSDKTEPVMEGDTVSWQLSPENKRFYYQCTMPENSTVLPWSFDLSYKLNGMEIDAQKLAGAAGLVEVNVKATPDKKARAYYRNNMMLSVIVPVDMEKCYSVDAPGSQLQSVGNNTVAIFAALPGEEGDYTVRIGTDSFESVGVMMMMVPGTMSALDNIKDIKETKDTWRADGDKMYDSVNSLLKTMESMKSDVIEVKGGLNSLDNAREQVSGNRKALENLSTQALIDLASFTEQTTAVIPYLETAQNAVSHINDNVNALYSTMADTQEELDKLYDRLSSLRRSLESTSQKIGEGITPDEQQLLFSELQQTTEEMQQLLAALGPLLGGGRSVYDLTEEDLQELYDSLESADSFRYDRKVARKTSRTEEDGSAIKAFGKEDILQEDRSLSTKGPSGLPGSGGVNETDFEEWSDEDLNEYADGSEEALQALFGTGYQSSVGDLLSQVDSMIGSGEEIQKNAGLIIQKVNTISSAIGSTGHQTAQTVSALRGVTDELINLMDDSRVLIDTVDSYVPSMLDSLGATKELMDRLAKAMGSTHAVLSLANNTIISAGDSLDAGTRDSLKGFVSMLDKSLTLLDATAEVRLAGESMKGTLDGQLDKFEDENQFLNMDPDAPMISFTSNKNPSPHSLQIIVRTDEISADDDGTQLEDMEDSAKPAEVNPLARMWNVIVEIFKTVANIFKNR